MTPVASNANPRIAVVEDEPDLRASMVDFLQVCGYPVWAAASGEEFFATLAERPVDVVVLDIQLPGQDGFAIAEQLHRQSSLGIVIVSARDAIDDRLTGLEKGADVYLVKPVDMRELLANIHSVHRRLSRQAAAADSPAPPWALNLKDWTLTDPKSRTLSLTPKEYLLMRTLVEAKGEMVSKAQLAMVLGGNRGPGAVDNHAMDVLIARLRKKCQDQIQTALPLRTVTGLGFMLTEAAVTVEG